jgi:DNA-directed RNA polymerase specialized sigma24 family protein
VAPRSNLPDGEWAHRARAGQRCRQGDETAFRELVDEYKGLVFALIARSIPNRARAEELAQDVFLKVHKGLPYFRGEAKLSTWMYRIVINVLSAERPELATASLDDHDDADRPRVQPAADDRAFGDLVMKDRRRRRSSSCRFGAGPHQRALFEGHALRRSRRGAEHADGGDAPPPGEAAPAAPARNGVSLTCVATTWNR